MYTDIIEIYLDDRAVGKELSKAGTVKEIVAKYPSLTPARVRALINYSRVMDVLEVLEVDGSKMTVSNTKPFATIADEDIAVAVDNLNANKKITQKMVKIELGVWKEPKPKVVEVAEVVEPTMSVEEAETLIEAMNTLKALYEMMLKWTDLNRRQKAMKEEFSFINDDMSYYFTKLGLSPGEDFAAIKKKYKKIVRMVHPDLHGGDGEELKELLNDFSYVKEYYKKVA